MSIIAERIRCFSHFFLIFCGRHQNQGNTVNKRRNGRLSKMIFDAKKVTRLSQPKKISKSLKSLTTPAVPSDCRCLGGPKCQRSWHDQLAAWVICAAGSRSSIGIHRQHRARSHSVQLSALTSQYQHHVWSRSRVHSNE